MQEYKTFKDLTKIISLFNSLETETLSVTEISKAVGMSPSKVSRMLGTLASERFFEKNMENGKYRLGILFFELGVVYTFHLPLRKIVRPHLEQIAKETNFATCCAVLKDDKVILIDRVQNLSLDLLTYRTILNVPIHTTSTAKILLAHLPEEEQDKILQSADLEKYTEATVTEPKLIKENLKLIREKGYATDEQETNQDFNCIAAPIRDSTGEVIAAINLMGQKPKTSLEMMLQYVDYLKEKAYFISRQLGYTKP